MAYPGDMILQTCAFLALALGTLGSNLASVTLNILGDNDYAPEFPSPINSVIVPEGVYSFKKPFLVTKLEAQDLDSKLSGNVSYAVAGVCKNGWGKFHLREFNKLVLIAPVKEGDHFVILAEATDHGKPPRRDRCAVVVNVKPNSDGPSIPSDRYTVRLPEGIQTGSHVLTIPVRDNGNGTLQYEIASGNVNGDFAIDQEGVILNVNVLSVNNTGEYHLNVTVTDTNGSSDNTIVDIKVVQHYLHARNCSCKDKAPPNRPPSIPSPRYMVHIGEWALINTTIFTIPAVDPDGDNLTYSIVSGNAFKDLEVEPSSGRVINVHSLDYKRKPVYELRVQATDSRGQSASTRLQIIVIKNTSNSTNDDDSPLSDMIMKSEKCQCDMLNAGISDHHRNFLVVICALILTQSLWG